MTELKRFSIENAMAPQTILNRMCATHCLVAKLVSANTYEMKYKGPKSEMSTLAKEVDGKYIDVTVWEIVIPPKSYVRSGCSG